jgi:crotonobetainyl-CoA:carnitine CoA-transferase CaiB-like acyl-CoA transferase
MKQPLDGVRVLDLSRMLTGGYATMLLGDLGAEVIKIEPPAGGDPLRAMPPHFDRGESAYFLAISRNKKSVTLDLRTDAGRALLHRLVPRADVVFDNFRPGVLQRLGADYLTLRDLHGGIICCSNSTYGHTGPLKDGPGFDLVIQALSGMMSYTGEPGRPPVRMGAPMGDLAGSLFAVYAISAALYAREKTGQGRQIDLSLLDCLVSLHTYVSQYYWVGGEQPGPAGSGHMSVVPYRAYRTADGHLTIAVFVDKFWRLLCNVLGEPDLGSDARYATTSARLERRAEVDGLLEERLAKRTNAAWMALLEDAGVPAAPVLGVDEVLAHPQLVARDMIVQVDHPSGEPPALPMVGNPVRQPDVEHQPYAPAPRLGEHTDEILGSLLGLTASELAALRAEKVI